MRITAFAKVACITFPGAPDRPNRLKKQIDATIREPKIDQQLCGISGGRKEEPGEFSVGSTKLVRGDFSKARGTLAMHQVSLVTLQKGYAISFTFIGGSEDEVNELIEKLSLASRKPAR